MSARTADEVERSLEQHRAELERAVADLRGGLRQVTDVGSYVSRYKAQATSAVTRNPEQLTVAAGALGFVAGGGATGTARIPFKYVRVALGRPSRLEGLSMKDRHSKQLAGALVALANADRQLRRRGGVLGITVRTARRAAIVLPVLGAGWAYMVSDEERFALLEQGADGVLDRLEGLDRLLPS